MRKYVPFRSSSNATWRRASGFAFMYAEPLSFKEGYACFMLKTHISPKRTFFLPHRSRPFHMQLQPSAWSAIKHSSLWSYVMALIIRLSHLSHYLQHYRRRRWRDTALSCPPLNWLSSVLVVHLIRTIIELHHSAAIHNLSMTLSSLTVY